MKRWNTKSLLCWALFLTQLTSPASVYGKQRPKHHSSAAAATREAAPGHLNIPTVGGYLEEDEEEDEDDVSSVVPLEAAQQHLSLMPDRPLVEEEAAVGPPLAQLDVRKKAATRGSTESGLADGKGGLPFCSAAGLGQVAYCSTAALLAMVWYDRQMGMACP